jgi:TRAP transporter 4TM/12TM fusion protein
MHVGAVSHLGVCMTETKSSETHTSETNFPGAKASGSKSPIGDLDLKKAQELEESLDHEIRFRPLLPATAWLVSGMLLVLSLFHYYTAGFGLLPEVTHRGIHLAFVIGLIFLVFSANKKNNSRPPKASLLRPLGISVLDWALFAAAVVSSLYVPWIFHDLVFRVGNPGPVDVVMGSLAILVLIEATRRAIGWPLPIIAIVLMLYAMAGPSLPGILAHPGNSWKAIVNHLYLTSQGVYGIALGVVATYVFHYVLFGVLATRVGLGKLFIDLAMAMAGRFSGGPAKVSIFASGMFGMISGSSIANTVTVGSLTIPMMIRTGYPRHFAGAVESTAATGGQITPPIMGAAAFLMVEFLNLPYQTIIIAAIVPAAMHFFGVFCQVHFEAKKLGLKGVPQSELPRAREVLREGWPSITPLVVLLAVLLSGYTPYLAAFWGITACMVVGLTNRNKFVSVALLIIMVALIATGAIITVWGLTVAFGFSALASLAFLLRDAKQASLARVIDMADAFVTGAKYAIGVGAAAATVGIIIGVVTLTGIGFKLSDIVIGFARDLTTITSAVIPSAWFTPQTLTLFFTLVMTGMVCILLGCGIPTTASYIIMVTIAQPALGKLGVEPIVSHFFVFYYGLLADITPPVALAAYAGASMAGADPFKTGNTAFRLGLAKVLVPFVFVFSPAMLIVTKGFTWSEFAFTVTGCIIGIVMLAAAVTGYGLTVMKRWEQLLLFIGSVLVISPNVTATLIGVALAVPVLFRQIRAARASPATA